MSTTIDQRVVEMRFDNKQFESNVSQTMSSLDKLKQSLKLPGAAKGLEDVGAAAKRTDMSGLSSAVETVGLKFNAMYTIADQALRNITNSAMNAGKKIVSALTIDPIKTGFNEYETKINAIQTIMSNTASKGTTMEDVRRVIGELNTYADKTIYNFAEMTRNIGTFTAAGVGLEESASAIQGIANLAAASGSTSQQASTAMYQLSQALSSGTVKLMDWNSVVNAGMGGQKFQDALKATARDHGVAVDDMIKKHGSFRESLTEGWISAEILNETLSKFTVEGAQAYAKSMQESGKWTKEQADALIKEAQSMEDAATKVKTFTQLWDTLKESAQSGWSQTWEIIVGDFEEAKETLTKFSDVIGGMIGAAADARNELLQGWKDQGGRADLLESVWNVFDAVMSVVKPIKEAFREIFPPITVKQLVNFTKSLKEVTAKLKLSDETADNLKRTFKGLFSVLGIVAQIFSAVFKAVGSLFGVTGQLGGGILSLTARIGDLLVKFHDIIKKSDVFNKVLSGVASAIKFVVGAVSGLFGFLTERLIFPGFEMLHSVLEGIFTGISNVTEAASGMKSGITGAFDSIGNAVENCSVFKIFMGLWKLIKTIGSGILEISGKVVSGIANSFSNGSLSGIMDFINGLISGGIGIGLIKFIKALTDPLEGFGDMMEGITGIFEGVGGCLEAYQTKLKSGALLKIASAIAILAAACLVLSTIDNEKLTSALGAITVMFADLVISLSLFGKIGGVTGVTKMSTVMISVSIAVLILASALKKISNLDPESIGKGLLGIAGLTGIVIASAKLLSSADGKVMKGATQLVLFAAAIKILASACEDLSYLSWEGLAKGLTGIGILMAEIVLFTKTANFDGKSMFTATGIVLLAAAIKILASACEVFAYMSWEDIAKGLATVGSLLAEIVLFVNSTGDAKKVISTGIALIAIGAAMKIFASVMTDIAQLSWEELAKGLIGMGVALGLVAAAVHLMPKNLISTGVGLIAVSTAILMLTSALNGLGGMSWEEIGRGFVALGGSLLILAFGLHAMKNTLAGSAALLVAAISLAIFVPTLALLGAMSWATIGKGLIALAGAFTVLGVAGAILGPLVPVILGLAGAFALIGVGAVALGAGLTMISVGFTSLCVSIATGATTLVGGLTVIIVGLIDLIPQVAIAIAKGIVALCSTLADSIEPIARLIKAVVLSLCDILVECAPVIADTVLNLLAQILKSLVAYTPQIVDSLFQFLIGVIDGLARNIPPLIKSVVNLFMSIFVGAVDALGEVEIDILLKAIAGVGIVAVLMGALAAAAPLAPAAMVGVLAIGGIIAEIAILLAAIGALAQIPGLDWLINEGGKLLESIGTAFGKFIGGFIGGIASGSLEGLTDFAELLAEFADIMSTIDFSSFGEALNAMKLLVDISNQVPNQGGMVAWFTGDNSIAKFGEELVELGRGLKGFSDSIDGINPEAMIAAATACKALVEIANLVPNEGGMVSWFTGDNSIAKFGGQLTSLGQGLKGFSDAVVDIKPEPVMAAAVACKALTEIANNVPNEGGMVTWFAGDNSIAKFGGQLTELGKGLKGFADQVVDINPEATLGAANVCKTLVDIASNVPNEGGITAWFTGDNSLSKFGGELTKLGEGLKGFADSVSGIESTEAIIAAANAGKSLAEMCSIIPNQGGVVAWFTGEQSISKFSGDLVSLGKGLKGFAAEVAGTNPETMTAASAAKSLADMCSVIPNQGGMAAWFVGEQSVSKFSTDLVSLGKGLKGFADNVVGVNPEVMTAATNAGKSLAEMCAVIPNQGGVVAWFTGEQSISKFGSQLIELGKGLKGFATEITGINPEAMTAAANAGKALAEMSNTIPNSGGVAAWFTGEKSVAKFGGQLTNLGKGLKSFADEVAGINPEAVSAAASAAKSLGEMVNTTPKNTEHIIKFGTNIGKFADKLKSYFEKMSGITVESANTAKSVIETVKTSAQSIDGSKLKSSAKGIEELIKALIKIKDIDSSYATEFNNTLKTLAKTSLDSFVKSFDGVDTKMQSIGETAISGFADGVKKNSSSVIKECESLSKSCASALSGKASSFKTAGSNLAEGLANGISLKAYVAVSAARAMAEAAAKAVRKALKINSPSKIFREIGTSIPEGFADGIDMLGGMVTKSTSAMSESAINGVRDSMARISDLVNSDIDTQPTIRPILDLSSVKAGTKTLGNMLDTESSVGVMANVGYISHAMANRNQNGGVGEIVSAIDSLNKNLKNNTGSTTNNYFDGISYNDGTEVADAVETIARAAILFRRT